MAKSPSEVQAHIRHVLSLPAPGPLDAAAEADRLSLRWEDGLAPVPTAIREMLQKREVLK
ncbi:hypothetical protein D3C72_2526990 [compost metagenome]